MASVSTRYRALLTDRSFLALLASSVLARMPLGMIPLAILLFARASTGSLLAAGLTVAAYTLTSAAFAPLQGAMLDRVGHRAVLLVAGVGQAGLLVALVLAGGAGAPAVLLAALAALAGALLPPVSACVRSLWPAAAPKGVALETVYALDAVTQEVIWTLGPLIVGVSAALGSSSAAVLVCAAVGVSGTLLFAGVPSVAAASGAGSREARRGGPLRSSGLRALLVAVSLVGVTIGALEVGLPALAIHLRAPSAAGLLLALLSLGSMAGGLLYGARSWSLGTGERHQLLLVAAAVTIVPLALARSLPAAVALSLLAGAAIAPMFSCQYALVGSLAPEGSAAEAFTWHTAALVAGIAAGSAAGGAIAQSLGVAAPFLFACVAVAVAAAVATAVRAGRR